VEIAGRDLGKDVVKCDEMGMVIMCLVGAAVQQEPVQAPFTPRKRESHSWMLSSVCVVLAKC